MENIKEVRNLMFNLYVRYGDLLARAEDGEDVSRELRVTLNDLRYADRLVARYVEFEL